MRITGPNNSLLSLLIFLCAGRLGLASQTIEIDTDNVGNEVKASMFGANFVYTWNNFDQLEASLTSLPQNVIRYPGGGVTESQFNPNDPDKKMDGSNVRGKSSIGRFIQNVNKYNWQAVFVVPTIRYTSDHSKGSREISNFVTNLLKGKYGTIETGRTLVFEVGNEFYVGQALSPSEYGAIAKTIVGAVEGGIQASGKSSNYDTKISVQSGQTPSDAKAVAQQMSGMGSKVDYLTVHWYPGRTEIQVGLRRFHGTKELYSTRLKNIASQFQRCAGFSKPFFLSEYNIKGREDTPHFDYGLRNPMGIMSIFAEGIRGNAQMSTVWPLIGSEHKTPAKYFVKSSGSSPVIPKTNAKFFRWLYDSIGRSARIIDGVVNPSYSSEGNFRQGIYVVPFKVGRDKLVVFCFGMEGPKEAVRLFFSNFAASSVTAKTLYTARGDERDKDVIAMERGLTPRIWSSNPSKVTFTMNGLSQYQVVKLEFVGRFT